MITRDEVELAFTMAMKGAGANQILAELAKIEDAARKTSAATQVATQPTLPGMQQIYTPVSVAAKVVPAGNQLPLPNFDATHEAAQVSQKDAQQVGTAWQNTYGNMTVAERTAYDAGAAGRQRTLEENKRITATIDEASTHTSMSLKEENRQRRELTAALRPYNQELSEALRKVNEMRKLQFAGRALTEISQTFFVPSVALLTGASLWAQNYVKNATVATATTMQWKAAMASLAQSQTKVGQTLADIGLPVLKELANLAVMGAEFVQRNPEAITFGLKAAAAMVGLSGLGLLAAKGIRLYADVQFMFATNNLIVAQHNLDVATVALTEKVAENTAALLGNTSTRQAAIPVGGGGVAITGLGATIAAISGLLAGNAIYNTIKKQTAPDAWTSERQITASALGQLGGAVSGFLWSVRKGTPILTEVTSAQDRFTKAIGAFLGVVKIPLSVPQKTDYSALLNDYITYQKGLETAQKTYDNAMKSNDEQANAQILQINETFNANRVRQDRDFALSEARAMEDFISSQIQAAADFQYQEQRTEENYYRSRAKAAKNYGDDALRAEEDHQIEMRRLLEDHNDKMVDLTANRDALGMIREIRAYEKQRSRAEEDYNLAASRRHEAYAQEMIDAEDNFARQRAQRIEDFERQQSEARNNFDKADARRKDDYARQQADAESERVNEINKIILAHNDKMAIIQANLDTETRQVTNAFGAREVTLGLIIDSAGRAAAAMLAYYTGLFNAYIAAFSAGSNVQYGTPGPRAAGGYAMGVIKTGEEGAEFVLSHRTTQIAEKAIGGRLTQEGILSMLGGRNNSSNQIIQLSGFTANDKLLIKDMIHNAIQKERELEFA